MALEMLVKPNKANKIIQALCNPDAQKNGLQGNCRVEFTISCRNGDMKTYVLKGDKAVQFRLFAGKPAKIEYVDDALLEQGLRISNHEKLPKVGNVCVNVCM